MGMAASQARYIELTARKTNVEYEGQQINQQRTALANESAGLFNRMLELNVPTPPNYTDFTTTSYTFSDGSKDYTIDKIATLTGSAEYNAKVTYYSTQTDYTGMYKERSDLSITSKTEGAKTVYYYGTTKLTEYDQDQDEAAVKQISLNEANSFVGKNYLNNETGKIYKYSSGGTTYFISLDQGVGTTTQPVQNCYAADIQHKVYDVSNAYLKKEDSGMYSQIQLENYSNTFDLASSKETDEQAYNQAMNEYVYQKSVYDKTIADINAKTEIIQQEDRTLELKLKQLDTEHNALQTEMDAVSKVIEKNVEDTFKTFS